MSFKIRILGAMLVVAVAASSAQSGFTRQQVFVGDNAGGDSEITTDANGDPVIVFSSWLLCGGLTGTSLYFAQRSGGVWAAEPIMNGACILRGSTASMLVAPGGQIQFAARSWHNVSAQFFDDLVFAERTGNAWTIQTLETGNDVGNDPSLRRDANGDLHLSFGNGDMHALRYAKRTAGVWTIETVDATDNAGGYSSLALLPDGSPVISYFAYTGRHLRYAHKVGGSWTTEEIESSVDLYGCTSLQVDASGTPRIAYGRPSGAVVYGERTGSGWTLQAVPASVGIPQADVRMQLDSAGNPHIVYQDRVAGDLYYLVRVGTDWARLTVDQQGNVGHAPAFCLDSNDVAHIAYGDWTTAPYAEKYAEGSGMTSGTAINPHGSPMALLQVVPNPSSGGSVRFNLDESLLGLGSLQARLLTVEGREVASVPIGASRVWEPRDSGGAQLPAGFYPVEIVGGGRVLAQSSVVILR